MKMRFPSHLLKNYKTFISGHGGESFDPKLSAKIKLLKKKYNLQKQLILKHNFKKNYLHNLILKSLSLNHFITPLERISFFSQTWFVENLFHKFASFQKLHCLVSLSNKVPHRKYHYSRFFLNKQFEKLTISNTLK